MPLRYSAGWKRAEKEWKVSRVSSVITDGRRPKSVRNSLLVSWLRGPNDSTATHTKVWVAAMPAARMFIVQNYLKHCKSPQAKQTTTLYVRYDLVTLIRHFYPRDAMHSAVFATATCPSISLSVCSSVRPSQPVLCLAERKQDREMYIIW